MSEAKWISLGQALRDYYRERTKIHAGQIILLLTLNYFKNFPDLKHSVILGTNYSPYSYDTRQNNFVFFPPKNLSFREGVMYSFHNEHDSYGKVMLEHHHVISAEEVLRDCGETEPFNLPQEKK